MPLSRLNSDRPSLERHARDRSNRERATLVRRALSSIDAVVDLVRADYLTHRFATHWHDACVVAIVERGALRTRVGRRTVVAPTGTIVVVRPGEVHTGESATPEGFSYRAVHAPPAVFGDPASEEGGLQVTAPAIVDAALAGAIAVAHAQLSTAMVDPLREGLLLDALALLMERHGHRVLPVVGREPRLVALVRDYLETHHARVVTLAELATLTGRSAFHVSRAFREHVGLPPYAFLARVRVRRALDLLTRGHSATMVAHETGFVDQSHFSRQFKRIMGMAPGQYARECGLSTQVRSPLVAQLASA